MRAKKSDVIWNYIGTFMSMGTNFIILPFLLYFLNSEELGLWYVFLSIGAIVTLFDFGFTPTIARNVAYCWSGAQTLNKTDVTFVKDQEPNFSLLKKIIITCKKIYLIISIIAVVLLVTIGTVYIVKVSSGINGHNQFIAWSIYCLAVFLNLYYGYYSVFLRGVGAIAQTNIANVVSRTFQIIISIILLYLDFDLIGVSLAYLGYGIIFRLLSKKYFYEYAEIGKFIEREYTIIKPSDIKDTFNIVWHNAWRDGLVSVSRYLSNQATIIISSIFFSLTVTGIYSISIQLITAISTISGTLYAAYQPSLQAAYIKNDLVESKRLMSVAMIVYCGTFWVGIFALLFLGIPMLKLINPDMLFNTTMLLLIALYDFLLKHHSYYASFISNTNKVTYMKSFLFSSFMGVLLALILIKTTNLDIWGLILAQIMVQAIYNNWAWPYKVMSLLNTSPIVMLKIGIEEIQKLLKIIFKKSYIHVK